MPDQPVIKILREGDTTKHDPYTIAIVSNPAYESEESPGTFKLDPITTQHSAFDKCVEYIVDCLFGNLPNQRERFLSDPLVVSRIRVVSIYANNLPVNNNNALIKVVGDFHARQEKFKLFFTQFNITPDVAFAVTAFEPQRKATGFRTIDSMSSNGISFEYDGNQYYHRFHHDFPGAVALHVESKSLTALHEFSHAASSWPNGYIADLYNASNTESFLINKKFARRIPTIFCSYNGVTYLSNPKRGKGAGNSYHPELIDTNFPALMDDYSSPEHGVAEQCQHDKLSRQFLLDRIRAKTQR